MHGAFIFPSALLINSSRGQPILCLFLPGSSPYQDILLVEWPFCITIPQSFHDIFLTFTYSILQIRESRMKNKTWKYIVQGTH